MEDFLSETTIHGTEFFESKNKSVRKGGYFVFFLAFCGLGYYVFDIYVKFKVKPLIVQEVNLVPASDFPFPAVTICNPLFARDQKPNLYEVLKNPGMKLSIEDQKILEANVQACAPELGKKLSKFYRNIDSTEIVKILAEKILSMKDSLATCSFAYKFINCERILNYVLTDYGFCFSYNLQGFHQLLNSEVISNDFNSYKRVKIAKNYAEADNHFASYETVNDDQDESLWSLEKGYSNDSFYIQPTRAVNLNAINIYPKLNKSDLNNLCPEHGKVFTIFLHMPSEILTPFHVKMFASSEKRIYFPISFESYKTDSKLKRYSPLERGCYFEGEKVLKYFKTYTKALCDFECLTNQTLMKCGCVKFSMPREKNTKVCRLNQTLCYLEVRRNYNKNMYKCKCLNSCAFIKYKLKYKVSTKIYKDVSANISENGSLYSRIEVHMSKNLGKEYSQTSIYSLYNGVCILNAKSSYLTLTVDPEIEKNEILKPSQEIPFPGITICTTIFTKNNIINYENSIKVLSLRRQMNISAKELNYFVTALHRFSPNKMNSLEGNINLIEKFDMMHYVNQSQYSVDEILFNCKLEQKLVKCSEIFKLCFGRYGFCYTFNQQNYQEIFSREISQDFIFYGSNEKSSWTLEKGYQNSKEFFYPYRASEKSLEISLRIPEFDATNVYLGLTNHFIYFKKPNDFTPTSSPYEIEFEAEKTFKFSAKVSNYKKDLKKFSPRNRGCYFDGEKKLKFFKIYTEKNCVAECLANLTLKTCGCVKYSMPRNSTMTTCLFTKETLCYNKLVKSFPSKELGNNPCGCFKPCNDIEYLVQKETNSIEGKPGEKLKNFLVSRIKFEFTDTLVTEEQYSNAYDLKDFITDVGGLLGLFLGCSTMSLVELFYHPIRKLIERFSRRNEVRIETVEEFEMEEDAEVDIEGVFGEHVVHPRICFEEVEI